MGGHSHHCPFPSHLQNGARPMSDPADSPSIERPLLPAETEQSAEQTRADARPMASAANENVASEGGTHKPRRVSLWPMILIGFGICLTLLWSAFLVWGAGKLLIELTLG